MSNTKTCKACDTNTALGVNGVCESCHYGSRGEQRHPTREDRRHRMFDRDGRPMWVSVPA